MAKQLDGRLAYADLLRVLASLAVIFIHVCGGAFAAFPAGSAGWDVLNVYDSLMHWCVPVFIMLSGMFMLDPKKEMTLPSLLLKHLLRILVALFFWGVLYGVSDYMLAGNAFSLEGLVSAVKNVLWGNTHYHLWFLYTIAGLYLITPLLRAFVKGASRSTFHYFFLLIFVLCSVLSLVLRLRPSQTLAFWLRSLYLPELAQVGLCYMGCYVAGYYLKTFTLNRVAEFIIYLLGILGAVSTVVGTHYFAVNLGNPNLPLYEYNAPGVLMMAVAVFVLFRYVIGVSEERGRRKGVGTVAQVSFGIYLVHDLFLTLLREFGVTAASFPPAISVPLISLGVFAASFAVAWLISKIPLVGKYLT
ncbi:MAG: acyltransferase family protein [Oscillospiraceae bacterium]